METPSTVTETEHLKYTETLLENNTFEAVKTTKKDATQILEQPPLLLGKETPTPSKYPTNTSYVALKPNFAKLPKKGCEIGIHEH